MPEEFLWVIGCFIPWDGEGSIRNISAAICPSARLFEEVAFSIRTLAVWAASLGL